MARSRTMRTARSASPLNPKMRARTSLGLALPFVVVSMIARAPRAPVTESSGTSALRSMRLLFCRPAVRSNTASGAAWNARTPASMCSMGTLSGNSKRTM